MKCCIVQNPFVSSKNIMDIIRFSVIRKIKQKQEPGSWLERVGVSESGSRFIQSILVEKCKVYFNSKIKGSLVSSHMLIKEEWGLLYIQRAGLQHKDIKWLMQRLNFSGLLVQGLIIQGKLFTSILINLNSRKLFGLIKLQE